MVNENYRQREFDFGKGYDSGNSGLEDEASKGGRKKSKLLRNLVIGGVIAGSLIVANAKYDLVDKLDHFIVREILPNPIPTEFKDETGRTIVKF